MDEDEIIKRCDIEDNKNISLKKFVIFVDVHEFRSVLRDYIIQENFDIIRMKNEKEMVTAICASKCCPWRIYASPSPYGVAFMINSYEPRHTCIRKSEKINANSIWIAKKLKQSLNANLNMSYKLMSNELITKFGVEAHPRQLYRVRKKGREEIESSHALSYKKIIKFANLQFEKHDCVEISRWTKSQNHDEILHIVFFYCILVYNVGPKIITEINKTTEMQDIANVAYM
ncbi:hypothetical protein Ahy_B01g057051 isoform B [Arachis hypogaea]|uniref:Transposase MuDR plant domain-containing protein n=1 Tax=Arachis hypogaea TaxID=3818 RepID=A0A445B064_ARAHY|nr:hypothetical protein Ahy_B01g057051 isoform B [Arachis hypogaea]